MMNAIPYYRGVEAQNNDGEKKANHWIWSFGSCDVRKAGIDLVKKVRMRSRTQIDW